MGSRVSTAWLQRARVPWRLALLLLLAGCLFGPPPAHAQPPKRSQFDHLTTGFELLGQHRDLPCESCHEKDDVHLGRYGRQCDRCHTTVTWKGARVQ